MFVSICLEIRNLVLLINSNRNSEVLLNRHILTTIRYSLTGPRPRLDAAVHILLTLTLLLQPGNDCLLPVEFFNAELYAILLAIKYILKSNLNNFVIFTDSYSALQFLKNPKLDHWIKILIIKALNSCDKSIVFEWISGHSGIEGNETADSAAKESISSNVITNIPLIFNDYKFLVKSLIHRQWQMLWSGTQCRLKNFKPTVGDWKSSYRDNRVEEKILSRLRTGSAYFLYQHKLDTNRVRERCATCDSDMSIDHLLITCPVFQPARVRITSYLHGCNLLLNEFDILNDDFNHNSLFDFLKEVNFY